MSEVLNIVYTLPARLLKVKLSLMMTDGTVEARPYIFVNGDQCQTAREH